ncbi:hypothetical protein HMPREF9012_0817 [Bacteroidetes bacterium oral taxon 272 str. F0290]|nr:hypothetical protein HMPREF9012_0817 [Bacteroidetes bacterium oral taxon 272 str. F0290]
MFRYGKYKVNFGNRQIIAFILSRLFPLEGGNEFAGRRPESSVFRRKFPEI